MSLAQASIEFIAPDLYEFEGDGVDVSYLPSGAGGKSWFTYQGAYGMLTFSGDEIRKVDVPDLGTVVSVTVVSTVDAGSTTFSVLVPHVNLPNHLGASAHIRTEGITTVHKFSIVPALNQGQREVYRVTRLHGTASNVIIPLEKE